MATATIDKIEIACHKCGKIARVKPTNKGLGRVPSGWKRHNSAVWCGECWNAAFVLRAITVPVVGPVDGTWPELRKSLADAWATARSVSNWMLDEMYARDVRREPGVEKMPPQPKTYLYPEATAKFPTLGASTIAAMEQSVGRKYRAVRYKILWTGEASLPAYRYPAPFTAPNQGWSVSINDAGQMLLSCRLGGRRWSLRLRGGAEFYRQISQIKKIIAGEAVQGELAIFRAAARDSDHRNGVPGNPAKGDAPKYRVMAKMVAWLPKPPATERDGILKCHTGHGSFLTALNDKDEKIWVENADHIARWIAEHRRRLDRWSEDAKAEQRPVPSFSKRRSDAAAKQNHRLASFISEAVSHVCGYAARRKFAAISLDDTDRSFAASFPWDRFLTSLSCKCDELGIRLSIASGKVVSETPDPLAEV